MLTETYDELKKTIPICPLCNLPEYTILSVYFQDKEQVFIEPCDKDYCTIHCKH